MPATDWPGYRSHSGGTSAPTLCIGAPSRRHRASRASGTTSRVASAVSVGSRQPRRPAIGPSRSMSRSIPAGCCDPNCACRRRMRTISASCRRNWAGQQVITVRACSSVMRSPRSSTTWADTMRPSTGSPLRRGRAASTCHTTSPSTRASWRASRKFMRTSCVLPRRRRPAVRQAPWTPRAISSSSVCRAPARLWWNAS